ncbi:MAG: hypothetical protein Q4G59_00745, partial [Planctomycetia bacterium]|nr:hypothetical protein [Planctomycetia bacterium]
NLLPPDTVSFDVLLIQIPYENRGLVRELWSEVDEQDIPWDHRQVLYDNGFRAGLMGASVPEVLSKLIALKGRPLRTSLEEVSMPGNNEMPLVASKPVTLQTGDRSLIDVYKDVVPSIPLLSVENGEISGQSYTDAVTMFSVMTKPLPDGSVEFELTPFIQFGSPRIVKRYQHANLVQTQEQPTKTFENLRTRLALRPGQFLVMGVSDEQTTGLGHYYFTRGNGDLEQKLIVIRLLVTQHDGQFDRFADFNELKRKSKESVDDGVPSEPEQVAEQKLE